MNTFFETANGRLYRGDCLEIMPQIPPGSIDMILCDPPYGTTEYEWDARVNMARLWEEYRRVAKPNAAIVLTARHRSQRTSSMRLGRGFGMKLFGRSLWRWVF